MKKLGFIGLLFLLLLVVGPGRIQAEAAQTHINLNGTEIEMPKETQVQLVNGTVMVPLRLVTVNLKYDVKWDNVTKTAVITQSDSTLKLTLNNPVAESSGKQVQLKVAPYLVGTVTYVPLAFVGTETGTDVSWDNISKTAYLVTPVKTPDSGPSNGTGGAGSGGGAAETGKNVQLMNLSFSDNRLVIAVSGSVTPNVFPLTGKDRIVVELPGTEFAQSFIQSPMLANKLSGTMAITGYPDISAIRYSLFSNDPSTIRVVMDMNSAKPYSVINAGDGLVIIDLNEKSSDDPATVDPADPISPPDTTVPFGRQIIVIDAGHGGKDPGAISTATKRTEKDFTLATALKIAALLDNDPNLEVVLTRSDDTYPTLQERAKLANDLKAALFVSIHANSIEAGSKTNPSGTETYYTRAESLQFAKVVHKYLVPASGLTDRSIRQSSLHVTRETKMPAILLECGYMSNSKDEALLFNASYQQKIAEAVVAGIKEYLGL
ncbi:N-acetylmuramoyl-L-alanine amidase [Paenibacillus sp. sgz500958]|uniref:N-acetylmuramoyl-L-alanine amidase n=1 Tax=Paenibacillus sp. sgz500958 TaxID=3242475 RepID=UPI0036D2A652